MTKLAQLIAIQEGGWHLVNGVLVGKPGTIPFDRNNPLDLRHSPHSRHTEHEAEGNIVGNEVRDASGRLVGPDDIGMIDTVENGWSDGERQLETYKSRLVFRDPVTGASVPDHYMTLRDAIYSWAPPSENDSARYLQDVIEGFGGLVDADTELSRVLEIPA